MAWPSIIYQPLQASNHQCLILQLRQRNLNPNLRPFVLNISHWLSPPMERSELGEIMKLVDLSVFVSVCLSVYMKLITAMTSLHKQCKQQRQLLH